MWYYSLNQYLREQFGEKIYKLALRGGTTCPNRDGTVGNRGCLFCSAGGSGDFAAPADRPLSEQIDYAKQLVRKGNAKRFIAYFQAYSNTYGPLPELRKRYGEALSYPEIAGLSIATRPDCLPPETIELLVSLQQTKPIWVELGLQTIHPQTADYIRRGYPLSCYDSAVRQLCSTGVHIVVHVILGLPGETKEQMLETIRYVGKSGVQGIKLQLLHVLRGTDLAADYQKGFFQTLSQEDYIDILLDCLEELPPSMVIHRLTGDGPKSLLLAPLWSGDKKRVLQAIRAEMVRRDLTQGSRWHS